MIIFFVPIKIIMFWALHVGWAFERFVAEKFFMRTMPFGLES